MNRIHFVPCTYMYTQSYYNLVIIPWQERLHPLLPLGVCWRILIHMRGLALIFSRVRDQIPITTSFPGSLLFPSRSGETLGTRLIAIILSCGLCYLGEILQPFFRPAKTKEVTVMQIVRALLEHLTRGSALL